MTAPKDRTSSKRKVVVKTPGGTVKIHRRKYRPSKPLCSECGTELLGVARGTPVKVAKLSKTQRRPERPYGGVLCTKCMRKKFVKEARQ